ncbi:hypothetical protein NYG95_08500 [Campylobacter felis]|uniref:Uncharacterized protein n=1 Tax=Campylobacter felis TaxID=2974565 RepID=A0ABT7I2H7_9BACT|nr:hypothetical protein [Campylobacter felis]MDL0102670.1 hypothetical protein [Campylobacter felis]MDL0110187.1 hypothetical protein [Campylobacter felis]MDL0146513.1 hypothetical protein [Campylobacter felis]MDL0147638.1 hypothetical protein [Campylobacter felis]
MRFFDRALRAAYTIFKGYVFYGFVYKRHFLGYKRAMKVSKKELTSPQ